MQLKVRSIMIIITISTLVLGEKAGREVTCLTQGHIAVHS